MSSIHTIPYGTVPLPFCQGLTGDNLPGKALLTRVNTLPKDSNRVKNLETTANSAYWPSGEEGVSAALLSRWPAQPP